MYADGAMRRIIARLTLAMSLGCIAGNVSSETNWRAEVQQKAPKTSGTPHSAFMLGS